MTENQSEKNRQTKFVEKHRERMKMVSLSGAIAVFHKGLDRTISPEEEK